tara:strand:- start:624 stop:1562 length:939 start_codon:yes stop_codon:yes gene_type:complete
MSNVTFTLRGLDTEVGLFRTVEYPQVPEPADIQHHYVVSQDISAADLNSVFWFRTTNPELTTTEGADDMEFATISSNWVQGGSDVVYSEYVPSDGLTANNSIAEVVSNYMKNTILKDLGVCRLSRQITGGYNNSDIFVNESELVAQYATLDTSVNNLLRTKLDAAGVISTPLANNTQDNTNITRELVNYCLGSSTPETVHRIHQMISDASGGAFATDVNNVSPGAYDATNIWVPFTFKDGDVLSFQLKYKVDQIVKDGTTSQVIDSINLQNTPQTLGGVAVDASGHQLGTNNITDQIFLVKMNVVGNDASRS